MMKKLSVLILILTLSVIYIAADVSATGLSLTGVGGRATVFGGAFRGVANDWSAAYWNPAGLVQLQRMQFGGSIEFVAPSASYTGIPLSGENFGVLSGGKIDGEDLTFIIPAAGFVYSTGKMAFGVAVFAPFGLGTEWDLFNTKNYNSGYPELDYDDNLRIIDIHPTFAYQVSEKLSIGVGVSLIHSDITIQMPRMTPNPHFFNPLLAPIKAGFEGFGGTFSAANKHILTDIQLEGKGWGFGGNIGLLYKATENLQIGVSARYYADQELDGSFVAKTYFINEPVNNGVNQAVLGGALQGGLIDQDTYNQLILIYSGASAETINEPSAKAIMPLPMNIGIGFAYTGMENMLLTFDVDFTQWSAWDVIDIELAKYANETLTENWKNVIRIAMGCEYTMDKLKLRGAFYTENEAAVDETFSPSIPDVGRRFVVCGGLGYNFGSLNFHLLGEYFIINDRDVDTWKLNNNSDGYDNFAGKYSASTFTLMAGFDYNF